jgi:GNAT superfamily N-acetyltransferase
MTSADMDTVIAIGRRIWLEHYVPIIGQAQVDYMTSQRFTPEYLGRYLNNPSAAAPTCWLDLLEADGQTVGYCSYSLDPGDHELRSGALKPAALKATTLKLEQLYLLPELHGRGLGGLMMRHIEQHARSLGLSTIWLTVNKYNAGSIAVYTKSGYTVREEAVFDIGNGFVMDDYVMEKNLP